MVWAAVAAAILAAGITQGALGFGFPAISTPILVLLTDVKTAIILNLLPNFWLASKPRLSAMVFGLTGGFFSGTLLRYVLFLLAVVLLWQGASWLLR